MKKFSGKIALMLLLLVTGLLLVACNDSEVSGENYPERPINAIVPWSAGGGSDIAFRGYIDYVSDELGQQINVQNITGANGGVGWAEAAAQNADGYNMTLLTFDILTNEALGTSEVSYKDFDIINIFTVQGMLLVTHSDYEWETIDDFLEAAKAAKAEGRQLTIATNGDFGVWHQAGIVMEEGTDTAGAYNYIPFDGSGEQNSELLGKHVDAIIVSPTTSMEYMREGSLRGLAVIGSERIEQLPDIPTFIEKGYDVHYESWRALAVPKGTPEAVLEVLRDAGKKAFDNGEFQEWATSASLDQVYMDHAEAVEYLDNLFPRVETAVSKFD